jgi:hypothetical protein
MPGKSRRSSRKKSFKTSKKVETRETVAAQPKPGVAAPVKTTVQPRPAAAVKTAPAPIMTYPYIKSELARIGIIAAVIFIIMVILYFVL